MSIDTLRARVLDVPRKPAGEEPTSWRSDLPSGNPDLPSPGKYEVTTNPITQELHVRVLAAAASDLTQEN